jgi:mannose/fructose/N-acetylgalactosamine-specific phosphotransferase system component IIB
VSLLLIRVDDRLVHGQVTQGWGNHLHPDRLVVVNDEVAADRWERDLYEASAPEGMTVSVLTLEESPQSIEAWLEKGEGLLVLVECPLDAVRLYDAGISFETLNLGGLHSREGRKRILPYVCVNEEDVDALEALRDRGVRIECADVPGCERKDFFEWLGSGVKET